MNSYQEPIISNISLTFITVNKINEYQKYAIFACLKSEIGMLTCNNT